MQFFENSEVRHFKKGMILLRQGAVCTFGCKVIRGCLRSYVIDEQGKEHIIQFAPEGWLITDLNGLMNKAPSNIFIDAIEESEVHWIQGEFNEIWNKASHEELIGQINLLTRNIIASNKRTQLLLNSTAQQRYLDFIQTYPTLTQRIPLKLIASYIGVTPEYLSEIRKKLVEK